ncbi:unnamed protein product [Coregonus sp. 'balchen']|uniref:Brain and acute leukemia cytoplasmic protein n=1 Tax=Coregonus suidteri TaxID=861788 RepID=A0AAN8KHG9_9TELE|nr:unnamed protein product [Coregonus sp. 'balchen']
MGCGGSRTDALEPRYLDSWTKETESTWLTSTDNDIPLSSIQSIDIPSENSSESLVSEKNITPDADFFEDGLPAPAQAYLKVCSDMSEADLNNVKPSAHPAILPAHHQEAVQPSPVTTVQRRSVLLTEEITKWQDNRMSTKQVTITVTQSIRHVDKSGKIKEKSLTTFEVMKPVEGLQDVTGGRCRNIRE